MTDGMSTSALLRHVQAELADTQIRLGDRAEALLAAQSALAASQRDLTSTRATVVELLGIIDAFQVASGADRNAAYGTGIDAVVRMRADLSAMERKRDEALAKLDRPCGSCHPCDAFGAARDRDLARAELASARVELDHLRAERNEAYGLRPTATTDGETP